jgi:hypothetical protein
MLERPFYAILYLRNRLEGLPRRIEGGFSLPSIAESVKLAA